MSLDWDIAQLPLPFLISLFRDSMTLHEFDALIDRMKLAFEYAENLGQYVDAAKVLYQMNEQLPDDLQLTLDELEESDAAKSFVMQYKSDMKTAISEYRERLMVF